MLTLPATVLNAILAHARDESPRECCGVLGGLDGVVSHAVPVVNELASPTAFRTEPRSTPAARSARSAASIDRGSDFKKDVTLKVDAPAKVEVKLSKDTVKASDGDTKFSIIVTPAKDAPVGEHVVKVTGTPVGGGDATTGEFKVKVMEK